MAEPLKSAYIKLERAGDHLDEFNRRMKQFRESVPWSVERELLNDRTEHVYRLDIREEPPPYLGTVIGDFFHNLRSALDSVAYDLSMTAIPPPTAADVRRISFPIARSEHAFNTSGRQAIRFAPQDAQDEIERIQPYHGWDPSWGDPHGDLWDIAEFNNIDKHRFVHPVPVMPFTFIWTRPHDVPEPIEADIREFGSSLTSGDTLGRFVFSDPQPDVDMKFLPTIDVAIGDAREPANLQLGRLLEVVRDRVVPRFERFV